MRIDNLPKTHKVFASRAFLIFTILISLTSLAYARDSVVSSIPRVACFIADDFPTVDAPPIGMSTLKNGLTGFNVSYLSANSLAEELSTARFEVLILPYGSAFPVEQWPEIRDFISAGGSLVVLGGCPFHQPVLRVKGNWIEGTPQPTYAHELLIGPADKIVLNSASFYSNNSKIFVPAGSDFDASGFQMPSTVYEMTYRFTTRNDFTDEIGSAGPRDAILRPLVQVVNGDGIPVACPLLEIDRLRGSDAGGRWIFESSDSKLTAGTIRFCVEQAIQGGVGIDAYPVLPCVDKGEIPIVRIERSRPGNTRIVPDSSLADVFVFDASGKTVYESSQLIRGTNSFISGEFHIATRGQLPPGFYKVAVKFPDVSWRPNSFTTGFWEMDKRLMDSGPRLTVSRDWFMKDGKVFPVIGTSYMGANAGRKFLLEPDPYTWEEDFARMQKIGINYVRTGLWTGWKEIMLDPGWVRESFMRSLDAFILTAASHNIVVCFNLFAFLPPSNGGANPYLDPRSLEWQDKFVSLIASRYRNIRWLNYDLINEPSYSPPDKIWREVPIGDIYERKAWKDWVLKNHPGEDPAQILDDWRQPGGDLFSLPGEADLNYSMIRENHLPRKALDFERFSQDVITGWAGHLRKLIRTDGGNPLVTLGQDEGGMSGRSSQQWHYTAVDYTSVHTWWLNDDLLWDVASTKVPEKPDLVEETGLMRLEDIDGEPWRSPADAADLLGRKFAYAFMGEGAGAVEWCWNINEYQSTDNEVAIGLTRPDGTMKIETKVLIDFADFFRKAEPYLSDYKRDSVVVVIPDSKLFTGMPNAYDGVKRVVKVLAEDFGIVPTMLSEYKLTADRLDGARLVIVPDPGMICDSAASELFRASTHGTKILFTGAVEGNEYGKISDAFGLLGIDPNSRPVSLYEPTHWGIAGKDSTNIVTFGNGKSGFLKKSISSTCDSLKGNIIDEPLPLELANEGGPLVALLDAVLGYAGVRTFRQFSPVASRVMESKGSALVVCVNESSTKAEREVTVLGKRFVIPVKGGGYRLVLFDRKNDGIIAVTEGDPVTGE